MQINKNLGPSYNLPTHKYIFILFKGAIIFLSTFIEKNI